MMQPRSRGPGWVLGHKLMPTVYQPFHRKMRITGRLELGFFCRQFSENQNAITDQHAKSQKMGISLFFYREPN